MDEEDEQDFVAPIDAHLFTLPPDPNVQIVIDAYRPSRSTRRLYSERNRKIYPEAFIENKRLGTLEDLSVRALAKLGTRHIVPSVKQNKRKLGLHYDALDVDTPLKDCYFVEHPGFWRRVVMAKCHDPLLLFKKLEDYDWRSRGISVKYVELVENCPAAHWPEKKMVELALLVKEFVSDMHISRLQSAHDEYFLPFVESEPRLGASSEESEPSDVSSDEQDTCDEVEEEALEEAEPVPPPKKFPRKSEKVHVVVEEVVDIESVESMDMDAKSILEEAQLREASAIRHQMMRRQARHERNEVRQKLRDFRVQKKMEHQKRAEIQALLRIPPIIPPPPKKKKKKKGDTTPEILLGVFDIAVEPEPEDNENQICDRRNKDILLRRRKRYDYPHEDCHHINLSFLKYFDQLTSLTIQFLGPQMDFGYHKRHTRFSYDDIAHLAKGVRNLEQLKIFRLRNSLMDNMKLILIVKALRNLEDLEVVDFGCDNLEDNCYLALDMLLDRKNMLKSLELEYNMLGKNSINFIGNGLLTQSIENPEVTALEYLGLAHNLLPPEGLDDFIHKIVGTIHIQKLNLNGVALDADRMVSSVGYLLRKHKPLLHLDMTANALNPVCGKRLICALETNHRIIHFDCRGCGLSYDQEFDAFNIVRRNIYMNSIAFLEDPNLTEEEIIEILRVPLIRNFEKKRARNDECLRLRPSFAESHESLEVEQVEETERVMTEYDIWKTLVQAKAPENIKESSAISSESSEDLTFNYNPNSFDLNQFREHLCMPGQKDRYHYFRQQKNLN